MESIESQISASSQKGQRKIKVKRNQIQEIIMPYKKTVITVLDQFIGQQVPITYPRSDKYEAIERFYESRDCEIGEIINVEEFTVYTWWDKFLALFK